MNKSRCFACAATLISIGLAVACGSNPQPSNMVTDVYVAGYETNAANTLVAKYWKNGAPVALTDGTHGAYANSIFVSGADVYVAGVEGDGTNDIAKYWKNSTPLALTQGPARGFANSIFVSGPDVYVAGGGRRWRRGLLEEWHASATDGRNAASTSVFHTRCRS